MSDVETTSETSEKAKTGRGRSSSYATLGLAAAGTTALALVSVWIVAALLWPRLPDYIPLHFGMDGLPDYWGETTALNWFASPIISTIAVVFLAGTELLVNLIAVRWPNIVNVPAKKQFLALSPEDRLRSLLPLKALLRGMGGPVALVSLNVLLVTYEFAIGSDQLLISWWYVFGSMTVYTIAWLVCCIVLLRQSILKMTSNRETEGADGTEATGAE